MKTLLLLLTFLWVQLSFSQAIILNEVSNGPNGSKEYMEFLVMDTTANYICGQTTPPCIDIRGWIFDDNSGYHGTAGIAGGAMRFSFDDRWSCVPVGTIILVYNDVDPNPLIPAMDTTLNDGNCTFSAPISDVNLFESNSTTPGAIACSYPATGWIAGGVWTRISLANTSDCARIVDLAGCEVFSLCWNADNLNNMIYFPGSGTDDVWSFNDTDPYAQANWTEGCADVATCGTEDQTPGLPNNALNAAYIAQFNNNCSPITPIIASAIVNSNEVCGCDGQATGSASGSIPGYTYEWYDLTYNLIGQSTAVASGLCAGTYHVIATSSIDCVDTATIIIAAGPAVPTVTADNSGPICSNVASFTLNETGGDAVSWTWTSDGSAVITANADQAPTITNAVDGEIFTVIGTDGSGCTSSSQTTIVINMIPTAVVSNTGPLCAGVQLTLNETGGDATSWSWTSVNGSATITNTSDQSPIVDGAVNGEEFSATITDIDGCSNSASTVVSLLPSPSVVSISGGANYCSGDIINDIIVDVAGVANWSVDYTLDGVTQNATGTTTPINLGNTTGVYVVTNITDANCSSADTGTQTITVNADPSAPTAGTDSEYCSTVSFADMTASGNGGLMTWYSDASLLNPISTGDNLAPNNTEGATSYFVTETLNGCEGPASQVVITVNICSITIPTAFTPDGDGVNDIWEILAIDETYPENIVYVYNRWGTLLFTSIQGDYNNSSWDGTYKGKDLPVGSYYFIIEFNDEDNDKQNGIVSVVLNK